MNTRLGLSVVLCSPLLFFVVYRADYCVTNRKNDDECARIRAARLSNPSCAELVERLLFAQNCRRQKSQNRISFHHAARTQASPAALCKWLGLTNASWQITEKSEIKEEYASLSKESIFDRKNIIFACQRTILWGALEFWKLDESTALTPLLSFASETDVTSLNGQETQAFQPWRLADRLARALEVHNSNRVLFCPPLKRVLHICSALVLLFLYCKKSWKTAFGNAQLAQNEIAINRMIHKLGRR